MQTHLNVDLIVFEIASSVSVGLAAEAAGGLAHKTHGFADLSFQFHPPQSVRLQADSRLTFFVNGAP